VEQAPKLSMEEATTGLKVSSARHTLAHVRTRTRMDRPVTNSWTWQGDTSVVVPPASKAAKTTVAPGKAKSEPVW
jgi:hypothetical protein